MGRLVPLHADIELPPFRHGLWTCLECPWSDIGGVDAWFRHYMDQHFAKWEEQRADHDPNT